MRRTAVLSIALALVVASAVPASAATESDAASTIVQLTNQLRVDEGKSKVSVKSGLTSVADTWSESQLAGVVAAWKTYVNGGSLDVPLEHNPKFSSQIPSGWTAAAENVAWVCGYSSITSAAKAMEKAWENSSGHRKNMLGSYSHVGVGFAWDSATGCAFGTQNFAKYETASATKDASTTSVTFKDVSKSNGAYGAITWVTTQGIATGFGDGTYRPKDSVTRRQMAYFMYRYAGSPSKTGKSPFKDVSSSSAGAAAIAWVANSGVATGFGDGTYRPLDSVTRRQMAYFMYRYAGSPSFPLPSKSPYKDVKTSDPGYTAIAWLDYAGVSTGYSDGTFHPDSSVTRQQMALFMYRYAS